MPWPALPYAQWSDTCATLHMWTQVIGKIRMAQSPHMNHWWHVTLYVTSRGLDTSPIPDGDRTFEIVFDFLAHRLEITASSGETREIRLQAMTVADFYERVMRCLRDLKIDVRIDTLPAEVADPIRFEDDRVHKSYDAEAARRFWEALVCSDNVLKEFRSRFTGKVSPVHFFWGGFDLAVSRFSGRRAPKHPPIPGVSQKMIDDAYSHECSSVGFWPGGNGFDASYFAYTYPEPDGLSKAHVQPSAAAWNETMHEFMLPYDAVRKAADPERTLLDFCQSTYEAGADLARWPRGELERAS
ncbi:MAG TPA: DUF5996 family protein [Thermoanaerobaculia bacterium]|nr:DUF5996 family protein [Thermoanaerobaculia bacterium]